MVIQTWTKQYIDPNFISNKFIFFFLWKDYKLFIHWLFMGYDEKELVKLRCNNWKFGDKNKTQHQNLLQHKYCTKLIFT